MPTVLSERVSVRVVLFICCKLRSSSNTDELGAPWGCGVLKSHTSVSASAPLVHGRVCYCLNCLFSDRPRMIRTLHTNSYGTQTANRVTELCYGLLTGYDELRMLTCANAKCERRSCLIPCRLFSFNSTCALISIAIPLPFRRFSLLCSWLTPPITA